MRLRLLLAGLLGVVLLAAAFAYWAEYPAIPPSGPGVQSAFDSALVARGAELAGIGNCRVCHTRVDGPAYAGGRPMATPFGTIFSTNITSDPDTGLGRWSEAAFLRAMQEGVRRDGAHFYPVFPYDHFTKVSTADLRAIYAFLRSREAVRAPTPPNEVRFPLQFRTLIAGWKLLFFRPGKFRADPALSPLLNRGAYLVEGLAHCGVCHTPRNTLGAERRNRYLGGGEVEDWHAPALSASSPAPIPWTNDQLFAYLRYGFVERHGVAAGPMQPVAENLGRINEQDVKAIASFIGAMLGPSTADRREKVSSRAIGAPAADGDDGVLIYTGACALCHELNGQQFSARGIHLASSKVLAMPDPRNLAHVILEGIDAPAGTPSARMPGFATALTDRQVIALMAYLRANFTDKPPWSRVAEAVSRAKERAEKANGLSTARK